MTDTPERQYFVAAGRGTHVAIDTTALTDKRLSWKAKALHYYIRTQLEALSNQQELIAAGPDGRDSVGSGIRELIQHKYLFAKQQRDENGQFICMLYVSFPEPVHISDEQVSTLLSTGSVHMSPQNAPMGTPFTENPDTVQTGQDDIYYLTSLNKHISNKSLRDLSHNMEGATAPSSILENKPTDKIVKEILALWNSQPALPTHKFNPKYKKYRLCLAAVRQALRENTPAVIKEAIQAYNNLIENGHTVIGTKSPHRVGLDEFFKFSSYTQSVVDGFRPPMAMCGLTGWFDECSKGADYLYKKYARVRKTKNTDVARILEAGLESASSWRPRGNPQDATAFNLAADMVVNYYNEHRHSMPFSYMAGDLARDLINMVGEYNKPHPGTLSNARTWEAFERYLDETGVIRQSTGGDRGFTATAGV